MRYKSAGGSLLLELACFQHKEFCFKCVSFTGTLCWLHTYQIRQNSHTAWTPEHQAFGKAMVSGVPSPPSSLQLAQTTTKQHCHCAAPGSAVGGGDTAQDFLLPHRRVGWKARQRKAPDCDWSMGSNMRSRKWLVKHWSRLAQGNDGITIPRSVPKVCGCSAGGYGFVVNMVVLG